ncbi:MAG: hypothetical protein QOF98_1411, partial [Streptomyces sp.]|nr:hypothetical protein [Streptomyces sp.]
MNTERDDDSVQRSADGVGGTAPRSDERPEPDEHSERPHRTRRSRLTVAAVALAVLLAGGGGAYWAVAAGGDSDSAAGSPAPLRLDGPNAAAQDSDSGTIGGTTGGATYQLTGSLPKGPDSAAVYATAGGATEAQVQQLAKLLGVTGPVESDPGTWRIGPSGDTSGPALLVSRTAPGTWTYTRYGSPTGTVQPDSTVTGSGSSSSSNSGSSSSSSSSAATGTDTGSGTAPVSAQKAEEVAAPVLDGLGLSGARLDATQTVGAVRMVTADPVVGGLPTHGWSTTVQVGSDGVLTMGAGRLATLTKGDTYPVVSAASALKDLQAATGGGSDNGISTCVVPMPKPEPSQTPQAPQATPTVPGQDKTLPSALPCVPGNGQPTEVRGAVFGLSMQFVAGDQTLVPSWLFDTAPAGVEQTAVVAQPAVDPKYAQTGGATSAPTDPGAPSVNPGGPMEPASPVPSSDPNAPNLMKVSGYQADGSTLSLVFYGGVCDTYQATAAETAGQVRVTVTATPTNPGGVCMALAKKFTEKVTL